MQGSRPDGIAGRLDGVELTDVIVAICRGRKTGILDVGRGPIRNRLQFQDGRLIFASSSDPNRRLGEEMLRRGRVTVSQLEVALGQLGTGKRIGSLMVEAGILTPQDLHAAVLEQIKATVFEAITWMEGEYTFEEGELPTQENITVQVGTEELLLQGVRSVHSWTRIERGAGPPRTIYSLSDGWQDRADALALNLGEKLVLEHLSNGDRSLDQLCREICLSSFEVYRSLWSFKLVGLTDSTLVQAAPQGPDEGQLAETSFPELILRLGRQGETGVLYLRHQARERSFHFCEGKLLFATSNSADDGLVTYLFRRGMISLGDQSETKRRMLSNKRVGTILREMGVIDDQDLTEMVRQQIAEVVYDTFCWEIGDHVFMRGALPSVEQTTLEMDLDQVVAEGIRRIGSWTRVVRGCGGMDNPLCLTPDFLDVLDRMGAGVSEWEVVSALKRPQTPRRVCSICELGDFKICQILWTLKILGGLEDSPVELIEAALPIGDAEFETEVDSAPGPELESEPEPEPEPVPELHAEEVQDPLELTEPAPTPVEPAPVEATGFEIEHEEPEQEHEEESEQESEEERTDEVVAIGSAEAVAETGDFEIDDTQPMDFSQLRLKQHEATPEPPLTPEEAQARDDLSWALRELPDRMQREADAPDPLVDHDPIPVDDDPLEAESRDDPLLVERPPLIAEPPIEPEPTVEAEPLPVEPAEPPMELPPGMDAIISRFNAMHRVVFSAVRSEIGAGATNFVRSCCGRLEEGCVDPVDGVDLQSDGSWDLQGLKDAVAQRHIADPWKAYQCVLDSEFQSLEPILGQSRADRLKEKILQIEQAGTYS